MQGWEVEWNEMYILLQLVPSVQGTEGPVHVYRVRVPVPVYLVPYGTRYPVPTTKVLVLLSLVSTYY